MVEFRTEEMTINMGPSHPSTHGVLRLILKLDGEQIKATEPVIGYLHRSKEKLAESRTYFQYLPMIDRVDYLSGFFDMAAYCYAVETVAGIKVPKRAEYIRVITMELNRICSHLLWLGTFLLDLGATSPFFYAFREREAIYSLFEEITGGRMMYNYYRFGGCLKDMPAGWLKNVESFCIDMAEKIDEYEAIIRDNPIFLSRTKGVGVIQLEEAINYGVTGPNLRASGSLFDARKSFPYSIYPELDFNIIYGKNGDCYDRYLVRVGEMRESLKMIQQAISRIPGGSFEDLENQKELEKETKENSKVWSFDYNHITDQKINLIIFKPQAGESMSMIESPRGILSCYLVSDGTKNPYRVKWRAPSFSNLSYFPILVQDKLFSDLLAIFGSLDIILPEVDR